MTAVTRNYGRAALAAGVACAAVAACSSSGSSSSSSAAATASVTSAPPATGTSASAAPSSPTASPVSTTISKADCVVIKKVDTSAIATLEPMQSESKTQAAASMQTYLGQLNADLATLTSAKGKAVLSTWISDVKKTTTETTSAATTTVLGGLNTLSKACP